MNDIAPTTTEPVVTGTDAPAAATPTSPTTTPVATEDKTVTLSEKDYKNLISARDRAHQTASDTEATVETLAKEWEVNKFLEVNKDKFPDITLDDLMIASSPEELESIATDRQQRYEDVVQKRLLEVQRADAPILSPEQKAEQLKKLKENPGSGSFQKALEMKQSA